MTLQISAINNELSSLNTLLLELNSEEGRIDRQLEPELTAEATELLQIKKILEESLLVHSTLANLKNAVKAQMGRFIEAINKTISITTRAEKDKQISQVEIQNVRAIITDLKQVLVSLEVDIKAVATKIETILNYIKNIDIASQKKDRYEKLVTDNLLKLQKDTGARLDKLIEIAVIVEKNFNKLEEKV